MEARNTYEQVCSKRMEAQARTNEAMRKAVTARSADEYNKYLDDAIKAASDYKAWSMVKKSLDNN